mgnify:CR=1 FL=1
MANLVIGVDNGNAQTKTVNHMFPSGISKEDKEPALNVEWLKYEGNYYVLSQSRNAYMKDKTENEETLVLTLFAIAKEIETRGCYQPFLNIDLAVGLPPEHLTTLRQKFKDYFLQKDCYNFFYNGRKYAIHFDSVLVCPQAFSAIMPEITEIERRSRAYIVDIGGYTTDVIEFHEGKLQYSSCVSLDNGVITMFNKINRYLKTFDIFLSEHEIVSILSGNSHQFLNSQQMAWILGIADEYMGLLFRKLNELQFSPKSSYIYFVGGGSLLMKPYIEKLLLEGRFSINPSPHANAVGFELFVKQKKIKDKKVSDDGR